MPSSDAQAQLIRETYARCGLDPTRESDRPQYFEAHGTGTPTGDPIEARAIQSVFFPGDADGKDSQLMVGSIKTIIGHTEGTAGLAGVLKASLAVQHGQIPANLHFNKLNPEIQPFYNNLRVPTETTPWPAVPKGSPRRVSVNSFGFGGTNAHAIIESWDGPCSRGQGCAPEAHLAGPLVMSANSGPALAASAAALAGYLRAHADTHLGRLAYTLFQRTDLPFRAAFAATSAEQLADKLEASQESLKSSSRTTAVPEPLPPRILGVFTGQGAQWAAMGKELHGASDVFRSAMVQMQRSLDSLPETDRPDWSLTDQLGAPAETSRVGEAAVSQPLCAALQVALVDVLHAAGIEFAAVVGHSSGEIGAAYAAGYLDANDAIRIAYYRGVHSLLAQGPAGKRGKMMAVGMSFDQASRFCSEFGGALAVAASNSQTSCTLSGDAEAIQEAKSRLEEKGTFARVLAVDTAYHSHHMQPCAAPYLESMRQCGIQVQKGPKRCPWYSSVWGSNGRSRSFDNADGLLLEGQYWVDNLTRPVLFSQALARAVNEDQRFDLALEVGPHPALKGPSSETIKTLTGLSLPYSGALQRGQSAVEAFADALGLVWKSFSSPRPIITFDGIRRAFASDKPQKLAVLKGLPAYSWDHASLLWKESRASRIFRTQSQPRHELLGHAVTHGEGSRREVHWKQVVRLNELPWLRGHRIQGEVLFPASGYLAMSYEAAMRLVDDQQSVRLVEVHDIDIVRVMSLEEDSSGLELLFTVRVMSQSESCIAAEVACYSGAVDAAQPLDTPQTGLTAHFSGGLRLWLGQPHKNALPRRTEPLLPMDTLDMEQVYSSLSKEGFNYSESFQAKSMLRRLNHAVVTVSSPPGPSSMRACMHPAPVDTAIQGLLAGLSFPGDGRIGTTYLPTRIECVRISMALSESDAPVFTADSVVTSTDVTTMTGDVDLFDAADAHTEVQMRGVRMTAVGQREDRWLYAGETWARDAAYGIEPGLGAQLSDDHRVLYEQLVRTAYFYLRQLRSKIRPPELMLMGKFRKHMMRWIAEHLFPQIEAGEHPDIRPEWKNDTLEMVQQWRNSQPSENNDMNLLHAMGQNLVAIVRGTVPPLKVLVQDGMLDRLYVQGIGFQDGNVDLGAMIKQLGHQHPRMRIVEVGAGTGGTTRTVLGALGNRYAAYTYTDISTGFFENARSVFSQHISRLSFKTLNIENDPVDQGFTKGSFDMVIASNCLHATRSLEDTLRHCRRLLRPGGRLVLLEITRDFLPIQLIMATLPGWFLGMDEGRVWAPTVSLDRWDKLLKATGFSGVDVSSTPSYCSVIVSQAVDETVQVLREPLAVPPQALPPLGEILIVGGADSKLVSQTQAILSAAVPAEAVVLPSLEGIQVPRGAAVICLGDLDSPVFRDMNQTRFKGLQDVIQTADVVLWVTSGAKSGKNPEANITVGMGSTLLAERSDLRLQFLDVDDPAAVDPSMLAKLLLRLAFMDQSKADELLWTRELELALKDGALYIPRVLSLDTLNRRSAARHRQVAQVTSLGSTDTAVVLGERQGAFELQVLPLGGATGDEMRLQVTASSLCTLSCDGYGPVYACIGRDLASEDKALALSGANSSLVTVAEGHVLYRWRDDKTAAEDSAQLHLFLARALAGRLLRDLKGPTWIHGAPDDLDEAIDIVAREQSLAVFQTTSDMARASEANFIHPYVSERDLQDMRPKGLQSFVNLERSQNEALSALMRASLPASAVVSKAVEDLTVGLSLSELGSLAKQHLHGGSQVPEEAVQVLAIDKVSTETSKELGPTAVVDWCAADTVSALIRPLEHRGLFASDKAYLLFGMTGDLGISVCQWMVDHGARNVVLASRNPNVPPSVLGFMSRKGATVRTMAVDITNRDCLRAAYADIGSSMPPVGGLMNAAMVLRDRLFHDMAWEDFAAVLAPKVQGTQNLDELFGDEQSGLDFFICFSSATSIVGTMGQSAYAAANHFMASLVQQRHQRGLPGSILHIAVLTGLGYIFRRDSEHTTAIDKALLPRLVRQAETDLHEMLAEAIVCGRPGSDQPAELITGIRTVFQGTWRDDARLSCYLGQQQLQDESAQEQAAGSVSVEAQLTAAEEPAERLAILEKRFAQALGNMLEMDPEQVDGNMPVASLGIDSLVAIRIREWFLKEVGIEVPVLKLMSVSHSLSRMCDDVLVDWRRLKKEEGPETDEKRPRARQEPR
ncbi:Polyketide synthase [Tolypocladium paradoxum]|uniref:Polyketide synthase n=1 Tax=Tolypocladium paradoxum TaxID=94208 RepID=A0A2S4KY61_9HYPO|nr:Polyketide synthase [Tolypocladium paradoxum]